MDALGRRIAALVAVGMLAGCGAGTTASVPTALTPSVAHHATSSSGQIRRQISTRVKILMVSYPGRATCWKD